MGKWCGEDKKHIFYCYCANNSTENKKTYPVLYEQMQSSLAVLSMEGPCRIDSNLVQTKGDKQWWAILLRWQRNRLGRAFSPGVSQRMFFHTTSSYCSTANWTTAEDYNKGFVANWACHRIRQATGRWIGRKSVRNLPGKEIMLQRQYARRWQVRVWMQAAIMCRKWKLVWNTDKLLPFKHCIEKII